MLSQVQALEGKDDIPCVVTVDDQNFLPEFNAQDPTNSCLGGFVMYARKNRIVCSQTLDDRLSMTFQQSIPAMRASLFPSLTKQRNKVIQWANIFPWLEWTPPSRQISKIYSRKPIKHHQTDIETTKFNRTFSRKRYCAAHTYLLSKDCLISIASAILFFFAWYVAFVK